MRVRTVSDLSSKFDTAFFVLLEFIFADHSSISANFRGSRILDGLKQVSANYSLFFVTDSFGSINLCVNFGDKIDKLFINCEFVECARILDSRLIKFEQVTIDGAILIELAVHTLT